MAVKVKCVHCGESVFELVTKCPSCGKPVANKYAPVNTTDAPWNKRQGNHKRMSLILPVTILIFVIGAGYLVYHFTR